MTTRATRRATTSGSVPFLQMTGSVILYTSDTSAGPGSVPFLRTVRPPRPCPEPDMPLTDRDSGALKIEHHPAGIVGLFLVYTAVAAVARWPCSRSRPPRPAPPPSAPRVGPSVGLRFGVGAADGAAGAELLGPRPLLGAGHPRERVDLPPRRPRPDGLRLRDDDRAPISGSPAPPPSNPSGSSTAIGGTPSSCWTCSSATGRPEPRSRSTGRSTTWPRAARSTPASSSSVRPRETAPRSCTETSRSRSAPLHRSDPEVRAGPAVRPRGSDRRYARAAPFRGRPRFISMMGRCCAC